jgi:hypothetical protein
LSPEERLKANDSAARTIQELEEEKTYDDLLEHTVDVKFRGHTIKVLDLKLEFKY